MSIVEKLAAHQDEMMQAVQNVQELVGRTKSGAKMLEVSADMAGSEEMTNLMATFGNQDVAEEERATLAQYMSDMMKRDLSNGMLMFAEYLKNAAKKPEFVSRADYYLSLADAAVNVNSAEIYQEYLTAYREFEEDKSPEAVAARKATEEMQEKMRGWAEI